jgi:hypothetical protein
MQVKTDLLQNLLDWEEEEGESGGGLILKSKEGQAVKCSDQIAKLSTFI